MENVAQETEKAISGAIKVDEKEIRDHLDGLVRQSVEDTLDALLNAEADAICHAGRYQRTPDRLDTRAGTCQDDIEGLPGNCGAVSFENEIFGGRREVPYSWSRRLKGGVPARVCMEQGWLHASYALHPSGGKLFVVAETMVGLLMGYPDGERNTHKVMQTRWWGKDSRLYMKELLVWMLK